MELDRDYALKVKAVAEETVDFITRMASQTDPKAALAGIGVGLMEFARELAREQGRHLRTEILGERVEDFLKDLHQVSEHPPAHLYCVGGAIIIIAELSASKEDNGGK